MKPDQTERADPKDAEIESLRLQLASALATIEQQQRVIWQLRAIMEQQPGVWQTTVMSPIEEWRPIPGYEGIYDVSNFGRVRSIGHHSKGTPRIMVPITNNGGHQRVSLSKDTIKVRHYIHRLVMLAFVGEPPVGYEVNHKDGDATNNLLENLEYATHQENIIHSIRVLGNHPPKFPTLTGENHPTAKLKEKDILAIRAARRQGVSTRVLAKQYGISVGHVIRVANNKTWVHVLEQNALIASELIDDGGGK